MSVMKWVLSVSLVIVSINMFSQEKMRTDSERSDARRSVNASYDDFNIYFQQDLENSTPGQYDLSEWVNDWNNPSGSSSTASRTFIVDYDLGGRNSRGMKWVFPENTYSVTPDYGYLWRTPIGESLEECYLSFSIMFKPGFDAVRSGKIPGVQGGEHPRAGKPPEWDGGYGGSLIFKADKNDPQRSPQPAFYVYHQDQEISVGDSPKWNGYTFDVSTDIWYDITYRIVMNTATATEIGGPDGENDGIMEGFVNGRLEGQVVDLRLRNLAQIGTDVIRLQAFFGGSDERWATNRDEWMIIDNVYVWTYSDTYLNDNPSVKRGTEPNAIGEEIYTPFDVLFNQGTTPDDDPDPTPEPETDTISPSVPTGLQALDSTQSSITFSWNASADNVGVTGYKTYIDGVILGATGNTTYTITQLDPSTRYAFSVSARDAEGNVSPKSPAINAYTRSKDTIPPTLPSNARFDRITSHSMEISWNPSQDNVGVARYEIYVDGDPRLSTNETFITISKLQPNTEYGVNIRAYDFSDNSSGLSEELTGITQSPDLEPPTVPTGLTETNITETTISLAWNPATDNVGITEYKIYVNQVDWETSTRTNETIAGLQPGITYNISVSALDEAENESQLSDPVTLVTKNSDITAQPKLPEISILQVQDNTINPRSISEMTSLGHAELRNFGIEVTRKDMADPESVIIHGVNNTQVVNQHRVSEGLVAFYNFSEGKGNIIRDRSGVEPNLDLEIDREALTVEWLIGQGLSINNNTSITSKGGAGKLLSSLTSTNEITLEAWIKQKEINQSGPARIITLSEGTSERAVTLAHNGNSAFYNYLARLNTSETDGNGNPDLSTSQDFISQSLHHILYTRNSNGLEKLFVNGVELAAGSRGGDFSSWKDGYELILANETTGDRPWRGTYYLVAVYNKSFSQKEAMQNYNAGLGDIRFINDLDTLDTNVSYRLTPFINTDQGLVFGNGKDFLFQNVTQTDSLFSFYPNPNNGQIYLIIRNQDENLESGIVRLADFAGHVHFTKEVDLSEGLRENIIELQLPQYLKNGFYMLFFIAGRRSVAEKFLLIR